MRQYGLATEDIRAMDNMIEVYEPTNSVVMVYVNNDGEISHPCHQTEPTPEECSRATGDNVTHSSPHPLTTSHIGTNCSID